MVKLCRLRTFPKLPFTSSAEKLTARAGSLERPCTHSADLTGSVKGSYVMNRGNFKGLQGSHPATKDGYGVDTRKTGVAYFSPNEPGGIYSAAFASFR